MIDAGPIVLVVTKEVFNKQMNSGGCSIAATSLPLVIMCKHLSWYSYGLTWLCGVLDVDKPLALLRI